MVVEFTFCVFFSGQCYKAFFRRHWRSGWIGESICRWQSFSALSNVSRFRCYTRMCSCLTYIVSIQGFLKIARISIVVIQNRQKTVRTVSRWYYNNTGIILAAILDVLSMPSDTNYVRCVRLAWISDEDCSFIFSPGVIDGGKSFIRLALLSYYSVCVCVCVCVCECVQTGGSFKRDRLLSDPSFWNYFWKLIKNWIIYSFQFF